MKEINIKKLTSIFNENRIKILFQLQGCKEHICGCDLVEKIEIPKNLLSYHIRFLANNGLIEEQRCGQRKNYRLSLKGEKIIEEIRKIHQII